MRLARAASSFNDMPCSDGYTGAFVFNGQLSLYDDTKRDSEAAQRRVLSLDPSASLPKRRVVQAAGTRFILGRSNPDSYRGRVIRVGYVAHEATDLVRVQSLLDVVTGLPGIRAWAGRAWIKNLADNEDSSDLTPEYQCHFAPNEPVSARMVLTFGTDVLLARTHRVGPAGTRIVLADQMPASAVQTATLESRTYNKVSEQWTSTQASVTAFCARWQSLYEYHEELTPKFGPMDQIVALAPTTLAKAGDQLTLAQGTYRLKSVYPFLGVLACAVEQL